MTDAQDRGMKFAYFVLGIALPVVGYAIWSKKCESTSVKQHIDELQDVAVEDSFPASDPPSAW
jgi:hypothetical protein